MTVQLSVAARNARLNSIPTTVGPSAILQIRTGVPPADCASASTGTVLATLPLPATYFAAAAGGAMAKTGTWEDVSADASGTAGHFRIFDSGVTTCHMQGTCGVGTGDLQLDSTIVVAGQDVVITAFTLTDGNA